MKPAMRKSLLLLAALVLWARPLAAEDRDYAGRARDLTALSRIFGELHHIRRSCEPRSEADVWRNRMRKLIELEMPQPALQQDMVEAFNKAYRSAEAAFPYCDRDARDRAAALAANGDEIASRLMAPLYDALARSGELTHVWGEEN